MFEYSWIFFIGFAVFLVMGLVSSYFAFKFRKTKIPTKEEMDFYKSLKGKNPSFWATHKFAYLLMLSFILLLIALLSLLAGFGVFVEGNQIT
ncbi:MAG: hypothetical protein ACRDCF_00855 [Mycoplasmoidaceae bacterium]